MTAETPRTLDERVVELEAKISDLEGEIHDLKWTIARMAHAKISDPRYPYWNWLLSRAVPDEVKMRLEDVLVRLGDRIQGEEPCEERRDIEGIPPELLWASGPPSTQDIFDAIKAATGMKRNSQCVELIRTLNGQTMFRPVCDYVLEEIDKD